MMDEAGILDPTHETFREYERVVDPKYLDQIRAEKQFSTKLLSRQSRVAKCAIRNFKNGKNTMPPALVGRGIASGMLAAFESGMACRGLTQFLVDSSTRKA
jgi:hypothetical protein